MNITVGRCTYPVRFGDYEPPDHEPCGEPAIVHIGAPRHRTADHAFEEVIVGAACQEHMFQEERRISSTYGGSTYGEPVPTAAIPADVAAVVAERDRYRETLENMLDLCIQNPTSYSAHGAFAAAVGEWMNRVADMLYAQPVTQEVPNDQPR